MRIPIVNELDEVLYHKDRKDRDPKREITRISALWILNENNEVLIAKRSKNKKHLPNLWGPSVAGSVEEGETYESNILKEAREEIGLILDKVTLGPKVRVSSSHGYFTQWFLVKISNDAKFILQEEEVDEVKWVSFDNLKLLLQDKPQEFLYNFTNHIKVAEEYANQS